MTSPTPSSSSTVRPKSDTPESRRIRQIYAIFGTGRCGSTWLGSIVNSHPDVAYRFEPFTRMLGNAAIRTTYQQIETGTIDGGIVNNLYDMLLPAHPTLDKPPFFHKSHTRQFGQRLVWAMTAKTPPLRWLFRAIYSPRGKPTLVFKEVSKEKFMCNLLCSTNLRVVYQVRHPCAVVSSMVRGQSQGVMGSGRIGVLASKLEEHNDALAAKYVPHLDTRSPFEKNALLWRMEVEETLDFVRGHPNVCIVVYESLCRNPIQESQRVLSHFNLDMHAQVRTFVEQSTTSDQHARRTSGDVLVKKYFSVFRDPVESMNKWKSQLSPDEQSSIRSIVEPSAAFQFYRELGNWE